MNGDSDEDFETKQLESVGKFLVTSNPDILALSRNLGGGPGLQGQKTYVSKQEKQRQRKRVNTVKV